MVATSTGYLTLALARRDEPKTRTGIPQPPAELKPDDPNSKPAPGRMFVVGRVLDPQGKPVPGATVMASARVKFKETVDALERPTLTEIGHVDADRTGTSGSTRRDVVARNDTFVAIALAPGFGVGWVTVDPDADMPTADITLQPEQLIQGRLFDVQARPVQGVTVSVSSIEREVIDDLPVVFRRFRVSSTNGLRSTICQAGPTPATTDAEGRFTIRGVGRRVKTGLSIIDPRFALQDVDVETDDAAGPKS